VIIRERQYDESERIRLGTMSPKDQWLDKTGGFQQGFNKRVDETLRLEKLFISGELADEQSRELVQRRICELKGIYFDGYDPPDD
jgi:hypothetical protein